MKKVSLTKALIQVIIHLWNNKYGSSLTITLPKIYSERIKDLNVTNKIIKQVAVQNEKSKRKYT